MILEDYWLLPLDLLVSAINLTSSKVNFPSPSASACPITASNSARVRFRCASFNSLREIKPSLFLSKAVKTSDEMRGTVIKSYKSEVSYLSVSTNTLGLRPSENQG